jgi:hypothetical protein
LRKAKQRERERGVDEGKRDEEILYPFPLWSVKREKDEVLR